MDQRSHQQNIKTSINIIKRMNVQDFFAGLTEDDIEKWEKGLYSDIEQADTQTHNSYHQDRSVIEYHTNFNDLTDVTWIVLSNLQMNRENKVICFDVLRKINRIACSIPNSVVVFLGNFWSQLSYSSLDLLDSILRFFSEEWKCKLVMLPGKDDFAGNTNVQTLISHVNRNIRVIDCPEKLGNAYFIPYKTGPFQLVDSVPIVFFHSEFRNPRGNVYQTLLENHNKDRIMINGYCDQFAIDHEQMMINIGSPFQISEDHYGQEKTIMHLHPDSSYKFEEIKDIRKFYVIMRPKWEIEKGTLKKGDSVKLIVPIYDSSFESKVRQFCENKGISISIVCKKRKKTLQNIVSSQNRSVKDNERNRERVVVDPICSDQQLKNLFTTHESASIELYWGDNQVDQTPELRYYSSFDKLNSNLVSRRINIEALSATNFQNYKEFSMSIQLSTQPNKYHLVGGNGKGKTTICKMVLWVLTGNTNLSYTKTRNSVDFIRNGCNECSVTISGNASNQHFTITRKADLSGGTSISGNIGNTTVQKQQTIDDLFGLRDTKSILNDIIILSSFFSETFSFAEWLTHLYHNQSVPEVDVFVNNSLVKLENFENNLKTYDDNLRERREKLQKEETLKKKELVKLEAAIHQLESDLKKLPSSQNLQQLEEERDELKNQGFDVSVDVEIAHLKNRKVEQTKSLEQLEEFKQGKKELGVSDISSEITNCESISKSTKVTDSNIGQVSSLFIIEDRNTRTKLAKALGSTMMAHVVKSTQEVLESKEDEVICLEDLQKLSIPESNQQNQRKWKIDSVSIPEHLHSDIRKLGMVLFEKTIKYDRYFNSSKCSYTKSLPNPEAQFRERMYTEQEQNEAKQRLNQLQTLQTLEKKAKQLGYPQQNTDILISKCRQNIRKLETDIQEMEKITQQNHKEFNAKYCSLIQKIEQGKLADSKREQLTKKNVEKHNLQEVLGKCGEEVTKLDKQIEIISHYQSQIPGVKKRLTAMAFEQLNQNLNTILRESFTKSAYSMKLFDNTGTRTVCKFVDQGYEKPWANASTGEKRMFALAFTCAYRRMVQAHIGLSFSFLFYDEVLNGLDVDNVPNAISLINENIDPEDLVIVTSHVDHDGNLSDFKKLMLSSSLVVQRSPSD